MCRPERAKHTSPGQRPGCTTQVFVPEGLLIIAQQFTAGSRMPLSVDLSPVGTVEEFRCLPRRSTFSVVPSGLKQSLVHRYPSDKSLGYYQKSLRDNVLLNDVRRRISVEQQGRCPGLSCCAPSGQKTSDFRRQKCYRYFFLRLGNKASKCCLL